MFAGGKAVRNEITKGVGVWKKKCVSILGEPGVIPQFRPWLLVHMSVGNNLKTPQIYNFASKRIFWN